MYHFYRHFLPIFRRELISPNNLVEELSHHFSRFIITCFNVFGSDSFAFWGFAFFEFVDCGLQLFCRYLLFGIVVVPVSAAVVVIITQFMF